LFINATQYSPEQIIVPRIDEAVLESALWFKDIKNVSPVKREELKLF